MAGYWPGSRSEIYTYGDCAYFNPRRCSRPLTIESASICRGFDEIEFGKPSRTVKRRGVRVVGTKRKGRLEASLLRVGRAGFGIGETIFSRGDPGRKNTFTDHLKLISRLRPVRKGTEARFEASGAIQGQMREVTLSLREEPLASEAAIVLVAAGFRSVAVWSRPDCFRAVSH